MRKPTYLWGVNLRKPKPNRAREIFEYCERNVPPKCAHCEFNSGTQCAGHQTRLDNGEDTYGMPIAEAEAMFPKGCKDYGISMEEWCKVAFSM